MCDLIKCEMHLETALLSWNRKGRGFEKRPCEGGGTEVRDQGQSKKRVEEQSWVWNLLVRKVPREWQWVNTEVPQHNARRHRSNAAAGHPSHFPQNRERNTYLSVASHIG